jgi:putative heme-binding domain-containing protein
MNCRLCRIRFACISSLVGMLMGGALVATASVTNYFLPDSELEVVLVDSDPKESFLSLQLDSAGRLFVGGREGLFVYEPNRKGLYQPRQLLHRFPANSWISDIAIRGDDLYVATHTAIYLLEDAVTSRVGLRPKRLLWGIPPLAYFEEHQGFHGLILGPDGDLYISFGDNLVGYGDFKRADHWGHWTFFHSQQRTPFTGAGGVLRMSPDGRNLEVLARGLRNPCGLVFDSQWNLFSNDNDHESIPNDYVPGRLLYVPPLAEYGWPRGWMPEKQPWRADLLDTLNPNLGRYIPSGQGYYDDTYLPGRFRHNLLVAEWGKGVVARYPLRSSGAGFKADELPLLICTNKVRPVGIGVGRGGRIFVATLYMAANEASPTTRSDIIMITRAGDSPDVSSDAYEETKVDESRLVSELANPSWQRRYRAHLELVRRVSLPDKPVLKEVPAAIHGIWLAAAQGQHGWLAELTDSRDARIRLQALRALTRFGKSPADREVFVKALADESAQVVQAGLIGLSLRFEDFPAPAVRALASSQDTFIRQAACQLLAARSSLAELQTMADSIAASNRLAAVVALGMRLTLPHASLPLPDDCPLDPSTFNPKPQYDEGLEDLREYGRIGAFTMAAYWAKKTKSQMEQGLFDALARRLNDADERVARQAAFYLRLLADPRTDEAAARQLNITNAPVVEPIQTAVAATSTELPAAYHNRDWPAEAAAGDAERGRVLFATLGCIKCHATSDQDPGGGGPSLANAGDRFSVSYLAESILVPNREVSPMFRGTELTFSDDEAISGLVVGETKDAVELLLINGTRQTFDKQDIASRRVQQLSSMPEGLISNPTELRDVLAFLISPAQKTKK